MALTPTVQNVAADGACLDQIKARGFGQPTNPHSSKRRPPFGPKRNPSCVAHKLVHHPCGQKRRRKAAAAFAIEAGQTAITVRLQPTDATLKEADIEAVSAKIVDKVTKATGGSLRG